MSTDLTLVVSQISLVSTKLCLALFCRHCLALETQIFLSEGVVLFDMEQCYPSAFSEGLNCDNNYSGKRTTRQAVLKLFVYGQMVQIGYGPSLSEADCVHNFD